MMTQALQVVILVLVALGAILVVMVRGRVRQVVALSAYGVGLAVLYLTVQAPNVTVPELVVGAVALPLILLLTITRVRWRR
jgi:energy-converting hydrogenase B subunit D